MVDNDATNQELVEGLRHLARNFTEAAVWSDTKFDEQKLLRAAAMLRLIATRNEVELADRVELEAWYEAGMITHRRMVEQRRAIRRLSELVEAI